jgi:hypothetical protein
MVDRTNTATNDPDPSLNSHYKSFVTTTNQSVRAPGGGLNPSRLWVVPVPGRSGRSGSRRLNVGHHVVNQQAPVRLIPELSRSTCDVPASMSSCSISTRHQRFVRARLPSPYLTPLTAPFPHTFTTTVFSQRSMRWFEASSCKAAPKGHTLISYAAPLRISLLHRHLLHVQDTTQVLTNISTGQAHSPLRACTMAESPQR